MNSLVGNVFIVVFGNIIQNVYSNQYLADIEADKLNQKAIEKGIKERAAVIVRDLYSF